MKYVNVLGLSKAENVQIQPTVNSQKSWTLFINHGGRNLYESSDQSSDTVAEICQNYQLKRKLDGKSIVIFVHNFPPQNHYYPPT